MSTSVITWEDIKNEPDARKVLDHGFVYLKSVYGTDSTVCEAARISYGKGTKSISDDRNLIRYLMRHYHSSPMEQVAATFIIKLPLFIQAQLVRHRTAKLNQYSGRYSEMPNEFFTPDQWREQSSSNKQGGENPIPYTPYLYGAEDMGEVEMHNLTAEEVAQDEYRGRLDSKVSRELARTCLPQSQYTLVVWQMDVHNLCHFLRLRMDSHAQKEIRDYADAMYELVKPKFPLCFEAFEDYRLYAKNFSKNEMKALTKLMCLDDLSNRAREEGGKCGLVGRELEEFVSKITALV